MGIYLETNMNRLFIVTASTGEYADKCSYNVFVCMTRESADICLRAIDNWFQLRGVHKEARHVKPGGFSRNSPLVYLRPVDFTKNGANRARRDAEEDFEKQFGVRISIDYNTGVEFDVAEVKVFNDELGS